MLKQITVRWGILTTIGAILVIGFSAGIWLKGSIDALGTLPTQVANLDGRLKTLEGIPDTIAISKRKLEAQIEFAKNDLKIYIIDLEIYKIRERLNPIMNKESELTQHEERSFNELKERERKLNEDMDDFKINRDKYMIILKE